LRVTEKCCLRTRQPEPPDVADPAERIARRPA
jgi:hypothetical protein